MSKYQISLNQFAECHEATENVKRRIIKQQLQPDRFRIPWYQLTKARIKKSFELKGNLDPIYEGINILRKRKPISKRQESDKKVSLEAMERFIIMKLPSVLKEIEYTVIKPKVKSIEVSDVDIIVAPDITVKGKLNGKTVLGGVKIHISKYKPFNLKKAQIVSTTIFNFLKYKVADSETEVLPELCYCLDIFSGRCVSAKEDSILVYKEIQEMCNDIKQLWDTV